MTITASVDLPSDATFDERSIQTLESSDRSLRAVGIYQESRRGALDSEIVHHEVYHVDTIVFETLVRSLEACGDAVKIDASHPQYKTLEGIYESLSDKQGLPLEMGNIE